MRGFFVTFGCLATGVVAVSKSIIANAETLSATTYVVIAGLVAVCALIAALPTVLERVNEVRIEARSIVAAIAMGGMAMYSVDFNANFAFVASPAQSAVAASDADVSSSSLPRHSDGHFRAIADVNGNNVPFLVDTGASIVLLTYEHAIAAGIDMKNLDFDLPILTANGRGHVAEVTLKKIQIGDVVVSNVRAAVAERGQLHASLLGMSFLGNIEEAVIRKDEMILRN